MFRVPSSLFLHQNRFAPIDSPSGSIDQQLELSPRAGYKRSLSRLSMLKKLVGLSPRIVNLPIGRRLAFLSFRRMPESRRFYIGFSFYGEGEGFQPLRNEHKGGN
jgi:hypothetical protein